MTRLRLPLSAITLGGEFQRDAVAQRTGIQPPPSPSHKIRPVMPDAVCTSASLRSRMRTVVTPVSGPMSPSSCCTRWRSAECGRDVPNDAEITGHHGRLGLAIEPDAPRWIRQGLPPGQHHRLAIAGQFRIALDRLTCAG